jgi:hypothetical protein
MRQNYKVHINIEYHSVCPSELGPLSRVCPPPEPKGGGGGKVHSPAGEGVLIPTTGEKSCAVCTLSTLWSKPTQGSVGGGGGGWGGNIDSERESEFRARYLISNIENQKIKKHSYLQ